MAPLESPRATRRFARDRSGIATSDAAASTMPGVLGEAGLRDQRFQAASVATYAASARKHAPTIFSVRASRRSRWQWSVSADIRHSSAAPDVTSMKLSTPNPTSDTLPASAPVVTPTRPSRLFQIIVKYSRRRARSASDARSAGSVRVVIPFYTPLTLSPHNAATVDTSTRSRCPMKTAVPPGWLLRKLRQDAELGERFVLLIMDRTTAALPFE